MNKNIETTNTDETIKPETIESIENVELDNMTGGCSACGCGQPNALVSQRPTAPWLRR